MSGFIRVSEKHGVNPSLLNCFFCGESKGIALLGRLPGDKEAPHAIVADYEPCDKCQEKQKEYILAIEVTGVQPSDNRPPIQNDAYPTGRSIWIRDRAFRNICSDAKLADAIIEKRVMLCDAQTMQMFIDMFNSIEAAVSNDEVGEDEKDSEVVVSADGSEYGVVHLKKKTVARKDWTCSRCNKPIYKGNEYTLIKVRKRGKFIFLRECLECSKKEK